MPGRHQTATGAGFYRQLEAAASRPVQVIRAAAACDRTGGDLAERHDHVQVANRVHTLTALIGSIVAIKLGA
jgi:hypothetical protein